MNFVLFLLISIPTQPLDGSIVFIANGSNLVQKHTNNPITHAAIIFNDEQRIPWVYEAAIPKVKKKPLSEYLSSFNKGLFKNDKDAKMCIAEPKTPFTQQQLLVMRNFAEQQLGRPYSIRPYLKGEESRGVHCSAFVTEILKTSGRYTSTNPGRVAPKNLWESIEKDFVFSPFISPLRPHAVHQNPPQSSPNLLYGHGVVGH